MTAAQEQAQGVRFPGESEEYRRARDELLQAEIELRERIEAVAEQRRRLPLGGELPEDYGFDEWDSATGTSRPVRLSELFEAGKDTLFLYSFIFIDDPNGNALGSPCPSCTSIVDALAGQARHLTQHGQSRRCGQGADREVPGARAHQGLAVDPPGLFRGQQLQQRLQRAVARRGAMADRERLRPRGRGDPSFLELRALLWAALARPGSRVTSTSCGRCGTSWTSRRRDAGATWAPAGVHLESMAGTPVLPTRDRGRAVGALVARREGRIGLLAAVLALAAAGWTISVARMAGMDAGPGTPLGSLGWFLPTWVLMMSAMMLPSIAPVAARRRRQGPASAGILEAGLFVAGYLAVWAIAGLVAFALVALARELSGGLFAWHAGGPWLAAAVLVTAGAYQLTAGKRRSLARCRDAGALFPAGAGWRRSLRAGLTAGGHCLACSWALMAALFALGAMSVAWMVLITVLIAAERLPSIATPGRVAAALVLLALAVGVAVAPARVPALTIPGSSSAMRAMERMMGPPQAAGSSRGGSGMSMPPGASGMPKSR